MKTTLFISFLLSGDTAAVGYWLAAVGIIALLVIVASVFDLRLGIKASKKVGQFKTTSFGLRKTVSKDKDYMTFYFFAVLIDSCLSFVLSFPAACVCVALAEILIEGVSVREKLAMLKKDVADPMAVAKAVATAYGINDAEKIAQVFKVITKQREAKDDGNNGNG